ncbi:ABC transporter permease [Paenibacillus yanchengensis]|uniref:ABC transporter permease n=1 Tax=Paenibacillus yanchengensis TaxID=2035833 RepID=A0ABW4YJ03_9BACL
MMDTSTIKSTNKQNAVVPTTSATYRFFTLMMKEMIEFIRNYKMIWVPLAFIAYGIMQPVVTYYLPFILDHAGNLPAGTVIEIPTPAAAEVLASTLQQYGIFAVIIIVLITMGAISQERVSGIASIILAKPISITTYVMSKWVAYVLLAWSSFLIGISITGYYTRLLFAPFDLSLFWSSVALYSLWIVFIVSVTLVFSSILRSSIAAAAATLVLLGGLTLLSSLPLQYLHYIPSRLPTIAAQMLIGDAVDSRQLLIIVVITLLVLVGLIRFAIVKLRKSAALD